MNKAQLIELIDKYIARETLKQDDIMNLLPHFNVTDKQKQVMLGLLNIGYGNTASYSEFAASIGFEKQIRAIATLVGKNPLPVIVPCHRIIRKNGEIGEYLLGANVKAELINFEQNASYTLSKNVTDAIYAFYSNAI